MLHLRFDVVGDVQLSRLLDRVSSDLSNMRPAWDLIHTNFLRGEQGTFALEGAFGGKPKWEPLSPKYELWKDQRYPGQPILVLTGALRASLTQASDPDHVYDATDSGMSVGTKKRTPGGRWNLGLLHQKGTRRMPARPPLILTEQQKNEWVGIMHDWLWGEVIPWRRQNEMRPPR